MQKHNVQKTWEISSPDDEDKFKLSYFKKRDRHREHHQHHSPPLIGFETTLLEPALQNSPRAKFAR